MERVARIEGRRATDVALLPAFLKLAGRRWCWSAGQRRSCEAAQAARCGRARDGRAHRSRRSSGFRPRLDGSSPRPIWTGRGMPSPRRLPEINREVSAARAGRRVFVNAVTTRRRPRLFGECRASRWSHVRLSTNVPPPALARLCATGAGGADSAGH